MSERTPYSRDETRGERLDRNFGEQLQEVRIAQAGVQILFAFLLTLPFQPRFTILTDLQRNIYVVHAGRRRRGRHPLHGPGRDAPDALPRRAQGLRRHLHDALIEIGLFALALSIVGGVVLVLDVLVSHTTAMAVGAADRRRWPSAVARRAGVAQADTSPRPSQRGRIAVPLGSVPPPRQSSGPTLHRPAGGFPLSTGLHLFGDRLAGLRGKVNPMTITFTENRIACRHVS